MAYASEWFPQALLLKYLRLPSRVSSSSTRRCAALWRSGERSGWNIPGHDGCQAVGLPRNEQLPRRQPGAIFSGHRPVLGAVALSWCPVLKRHGALGAVAWSLRPVFWNRRGRQPSRALQSTRSLVLNAAQCPARRDCWRLLLLPSSMRGLKRHCSHLLPMPRVTA